MLDPYFEMVASEQKWAPPKPLEYYATLIDDRDRAMATVYLDGHYTLQEVGSHFGVSYATVSRAVKRHKLDVKCKACNPDILFARV